MPPSRLLDLLIVALALALVLAVPFTPAIGQDDKQRSSIEFDGITIEFDAEEADVVELLKPALLNYRIARRARVDGEVKAAIDIFENPENRKRVEQRLKALFGVEQLSGDFDRHYDETLAELRAIAGLWKQWTGDLRQVRFWTRREAKAVLEDEVYRFGQIKYGTSGEEISFTTPLLRNGIGIDAFPSPDVEVLPLVIDIPIFYQPGTSAEEISAYPLKVLKRLPDVLVEVVLQGILRRAVLWTIESVARHELEALLFAGDDDRSDLLAAGLAAYYALLNEVASGDSKRALSAFAGLGNFAQPPGLSQAETVEALRDFVPLAPITDEGPLGELARRESRGLMANAFFNLTRVDKDNLGPAVLRQFAAKGIITPEGGFDSAGFLAAVDTAFGETDALASTMSELQHDALSKLENKLKQERSDAEAAEATPSADFPPKPPPPPPPDRITSFSGDYQITHPESLTDVVAEVAPQLAKNLGTARKLASDAFAAQKDMTVEVSEEDAEALTRYGLTADLDTLRQWAIGSSAFMNVEAPMMALLNTTQVEIWIKDELIRHLKSGGEVPNFTLDPKGKKVTFNFKFNSDFKLKEIESSQEVAEGFDSEHDFVWPIVLDATPEDITAQMIREDSSGLFGDEEQGKEGLLDPEDLRLLNAEQVYFVAVHETVELQLIKAYIASPDRRWFCDGMANWIAIQECERRFGDGTGIEIFESMYSPATYETLAPKVDLFGWPALENLGPYAKDQPAHYYFATRALLAACDGQDDDFVKRWLDEIDKNAWNRTNSSHIIAAYDKLTGKDLRQIVASVTAE